ncbi:hypothetical protein KR009_011245 [Drosophila setifemur]|nr:hypothetical protein KR009_011245 [Drosophila setifemur]
MNPACRLSLASTECQEWMGEVCAHCSQLLPDARQAALWDSWWPEEPAAPFKPHVSLMSAYDCHKLRKEVARQVAPHGDPEEPKLAVASASHPAWVICRFILVTLVLLTVILSMIFALCILIGAVRRWRKPKKCAPSPEPTPEERPKTRVTPAPSSASAENIKSSPQDPGKQSKKPRSLIAFGRKSDPRTRYGPYKHQKLLIPGPILDSPPPRPRLATG